MIRILVIAVLAAGGLLASNQGEDANVNSRYTVESVEFAGMGSGAPKLSSALRRQIDGIVGQKLDHTTLNRIAASLRDDLHAASVAVHVTRGFEPNHVRVEFVIESGFHREFDVSIPKFVYDSRQGWSGMAEATTALGHNDLVFGVVSDGDALTERYSGVETSVERGGLAGERVSVQFEMDSYHDQWNPATVAAAGGSQDLYRARQNFEPSATIVIAEPVTVTVGMSFERLDNELPGEGTDSANAVVAGVRFHRSWEDAAADRHEVDAIYGLRAATRFLASDFGYVRHMLNARYLFRRDRHAVIVDFTAGNISGNAPLYDRFVAGNASTLRGWNKFDLDPLGADRMVVGSVEYRYRYFQVFYDTGALWDKGDGTGQKQSVGVGVRTDGKEGLQLALAFPIRNGRAEPMFIAGFNF
jgi:Omp85 superfamily domain